MPLDRQLGRNPGAWFVAVVLAIPAGCAIDAKLAVTEPQQWGLAASRGSSSSVSGSSCRASAALLQEEGENAPAG